MLAIKQNKSSQNISQKLANDKLGLAQILYLLSGQNA